MLISPQALRRRRQGQIENILRPYYEVRTEKFPNPFFDFPFYVSQQPSQMRFVI